MMSHEQNASQERSLASPQMQKPRSRKIKVRMRPEQEESALYAVRAHGNRGNIFRAVYERTAPASKAIKAKCLECVDFDTDAIRECAGYTCPLWAYRPGYNPRKA